MRILKHRKTAGRALACLALVCLVLASTGAAQAQSLPVDGKTAKSMLFSPKGTDFRIVDHIYLSEADRRTLAYLPSIMKAEKVPMKYYGAIAIAPSAGLAARETTLFAMGYHDIENARRAALAGCNAARKGGKPCAIVAEVYPKGWEPRALQLNQDATRGFRKYRRGRKEKAFAISPATGEWAFAKGQGAEARALADCNALAARKADGKADCRIVIRD